MTRRFSRDIHRAPAPLALAVCSLTSFYAPPAGAGGVAATAPLTPLELGPGLAERLKVDGSPQTWSRAATPQDYLSDEALAGLPPPVVNGSSTSDYRAVGALIGCGSSCFSFCTGTLVEDTWVITAAHCVDALDSYARSGYSVWFGIGPAMGQLEDYVEVADWAEHPQYNSYSLAHDIGILELQDGLASVVDPLPVNEDPVTNAWKDHDLQYVGYGVTSDNANDGGVKRTAGMPVYRFDDGFVYTLDLQDQQNICYGDSGGAALEDLGGGVYELVAANSHVFGYTYSNYMCVGGGSGAARVDTHLDWILGYVQVGGYDPEQEGQGDSDDGDDGGSGGGGGGNDGGGGGDDPDTDGSGLSLSAPEILVPSGGSAMTRVLVEGASSYSLSLVTTPLHGQVELDQDGWLTYTSTDSHEGRDDFTVLAESQGAQAELDVPVEVFGRQATSGGGCGDMGLEQTSRDAVGGAAALLLVMPLGWGRRRS